MSRAEAWLLYGEGDGAKAARTLLIAVPAVVTLAVFGTPA